MLERPNISDSAISACLEAHYGLRVQDIHFLALGADVNTAVFEAITENAARYFVKLRKGNFDTMSLLVPKLLSEQGLKTIIAPYANQSQHLWTHLGEFKLALYPFVEGKDAYEVRLLDRHWLDFGQSLKVLHTASITSSISATIQHETYSDTWRKHVQGFLRLVEEKSFTELVASELAAFMKHKRSEIQQMLQRTEDLAAQLRHADQDFVLCHADCHAGNIFIATQGNFYLVDWDTVLLAPKERDLMFIGAGLFANHRSPDEEVRLFYQGYGATAINTHAIAYYRYERIIQDIAAYCEQLLLSEQGGDDRENSLRQLMSQFEAQGVVKIAHQTYSKLA